MNAALSPTPESGRTARYAQVVRLSKKSEWQIDRDVMRDRNFDFSRKFLPDGLSRVTLSCPHRRGHPCFQLLEPVLHDDDARPHALRGSCRVVLQHQEALAVA